MKRRNLGEGFEQPQLALFDDRPEPESSADQAARERFVESIEENFSIIAPAGVGKTQSIVERIVTIARHKRACEWLPCLVVVTYTKRAADEMQQRARAEILRAYPLFLSRCSINSIAPSSARSTASALSSCTTSVITLICPQNLSLSKTTTNSGSIFCRPASRWRD